MRDPRLRHKLINYVYLLAIRVVQIMIIDLIIMIKFAINKQSFESIDNELVKLRRGIGTTLSWERRGGKNTTWERGLKFFLVSNNTNELNVKMCNIKKEPDVKRSKY